MEIISSLFVGLAQMLCESMNMAERRRQKTDLKQAISDLEIATDELKAIRDELNLRIQQDDLEGRSCTNRSREWLSAVQVAENKTDSILARFKHREQRTRTRRRCLGCFGYADNKQCRRIRRVYSSKSCWRAEEIDLEKTGVPRPDKENKCKVMFTTRSMALCNNMGAECKLRVEFLGKEYAWKLFCDKAGRKDLLDSPASREYSE